RSDLMDMGWGLAPIYVGHQEFGPGNRLKDPVQEGQDDADEAAQLAWKAWFPPKSVVYLDVEGAPPSDTPEKPRRSMMIAYYQTWVEGIIKKNYYPGVYCSYLFAELLLAADVRPVVWTVGKPTGPAAFGSPFPVKDPADSGFQAAIWHWGL